MDSILAAENEAGGSGDAGDEPAPVAGDAEPPAKRSKPESGAGGSSGGGGSGGTSGGGSLPGGVNVGATDYNARDEFMVSLT